MGKLGYILLFAAIATPAHAYIDPNMGGLFAQIVTPLLVVVAFVWATFRHKLAVLKNKILRQPSDTARNGNVDEK